MKPFCICPCWKQHNDSGSLKRFIVCFLYPFTNLSAIRWVTPNCVCPGLRQTIYILVIIVVTFMICLVCSGVKCEVKFVIEFIKEVLRSCPFICCGRNITSVFVVFHLLYRSSKCFFYIPTCFMYSMIYSFCWDSSLQRPFCYCQNISII